MKKIAIILGSILISLSTASFGADKKSNERLSSAAFVQGTDAYKKGDWVSSMILLQKALAYPENNNDNTWYMLISSEMYAGDFNKAYNDCEAFMNNFPESLYTSYILYNKGRALYNMGEYEKSILLLSDFCHMYPDHEMYASALYWIGEAFYSSYNYDEARRLYERVVNEYPDCPKVSAAQFRLDSIDQRSREEKLLYLLKTTGEEYLSAKEDYERQLKMYGSESTAEARKRMADLQKKNADLELQNRNLLAEKDNLKNKYENSAKELFDLNNSNAPKDNEFILQLKKKASETQALLDEKTEKGESGKKSHK